MNYQILQDPYFGTLTLAPDKEEHCYYLHKSLTLEELPNELELYLQCSRAYPNSYHKLTYEFIIKNFSSLWENALNYLIQSGVGNNINQLRKAYYPASITIIETINSSQLPWELELLHSESFISSLSVEFINTTPLHYYVQA